MSLHVIERKVFVKKVSLQDYEQLTGVKFTLKHTGKMSGMVSLSTSTIENAICRKRAENPNSICHYCYAAKTMKRYTSLERKLAENSFKLTTSILKYAPILNASLVRFEAFGDLMNDIQVINYFNICKANPKVNFALWTKNPVFIEQAIKQGYSKPKNLVIVYSSAQVNVPENAPYDFIDKVFTVYSKDYIKEHKTDINCGARNCLACGRCYSKRTGKEVREQLK